MNYDRILIRYGEMSTKGRNRSKFTNKMKSNIKRLLSDDRIQIEAQRDRMFIYLNGASFEKVKVNLADVSGIQSFSPVVKTSQELNEIKAAALELVKRSMSGKTTFKVETRRADKTFPLDTHALNHAIGGHVLRGTEQLTVDVRNPDITLVVEVRKEAVYLSCETYPGAGGLPAGAAGKAVLLLSGGLDSPVAGYMMMKRGVEIEAVHFFSPPYTSERAKQKVVDLADTLTKFGGNIRLHIVPFTHIQETIHKQVPENYTMTSTRRIMMRIADRIRQQTGSLALVTGESLGQVASQTMESMAAINDVTNTPVLRPLIASDKLDIMEIARKIGTHDISILPFEDCCTIFTPAAPKTRPKTEKVQFFESFLDFDPLIDQAIHDTEIIMLPKKATELDDLL
ncbi:tRNA uracil 4-sulfurtransferase ThiI [Domibacillus epiphyticus]|uniref:Probable tRNA sulfurtransferase n=1 Tax=Domibacillus epiphyticus TaxID=1714355 RepID=A0A1V2A8X4_9BACI|nr:tRNA uracil 4-sulfurtransferase ThiI [Domibacillus epiphyticus]OMP67448.1 tRNA 4-thiouridine(8) synthase ThiI [Domibacillus epiphyticus]